MAQNFWTNSTAQDPKRAFRFTVTMTGDGLGMLWYAKSETKPKVVATGYNIPAGFASLIPNVGLSNPSKSTSVDALGEVKIDQIDSEGNSVETWTLNNAWIKDIAFGDLDYTQEALTEITMTVRYDWATFDSPANRQLFKPV